MKRFKRRRLEDKKLRSQPNTTAIGIGENLIKALQNFEFLKDQVSNNDLTMHIVNLRRF